MKLEILTRLDGKPMGINAEEVPQISPSLREPGATGPIGAQLVFGMAASRR